MAPRGRDALVTHDKVEDHMHAATHQWKHWISPRPCASALVLLCASLPLASAQSPGATLDTPSLSPHHLAEDAVRNEIKLIQYDHTYLRYRIHTRDSKGDVVRDVIESRDGTVARAVLKGDRPLTPDEDAAEHERLQAMLDSPSAFQKHVQKDQTGKKFAVDLITLLPDAMLFEYTSGQPQRAGKPAGSPPEIVIDFKPNPGWNPPTMTAQALTGVQGRCWIDASTHHLTRLEGTIFQGVNFGFGIFAHIYPGGKFALEQQPVGDSRWIVDHFQEQMTVRAMMVKTLKEDSELYAFEFAPVREMGYQDAIRLLLATPLPAYASASSSK